MLSKILTIVITVGIVVSLFVFSGCESDAQTAALIGTAAGAGIGQLAGGHTEGTLIGAAVGGGVGYIVGNEQDKRKTQAEMDNLRHDMNSETVHVTNSNGSIVAVRLQKSGPGYIGPRGEYYPARPDEDQLRPVYGF